MLKIVDFYDTEKIEIVFFGGKIAVLAKKFYLKSYHNA